MTLWPTSGDASRQKSDINADGADPRRTEPTHDCHSCRERELEATMTYFCELISALLVHNCLRLFCTVETVWISADLVREEPRTLCPTGLQPFPATLRSASLVVISCGRPL